MAASAFRKLDFAPPLASTYDKENTTVTVAPLVPITKYQEFEVDTTGTSQYHQKCCSPPRPSTSSYQQSTVPKKCFDQRRGKILLVFNFHDICMYM